MERALRRSWPARITALGFVAVIIFGNFAIADIVMGVDIAVWTFNGIWAGMAVAVLGGVCLVGLAAYRKLNAQPEPEVSEPRGGRP